MYKELTYKEALEFYNRWGRTILIGSSPNDYYSFNKIKDKKSLDDCIKQYLNYYDEPVHFFLDQRTADRDMELSQKNESKNMNKKLIRLTESDLHKIVRESVKRVLNESEEQQYENLKNMLLDAIRDAKENGYKAYTKNKYGTYVNVTCSPTQGGSTQIWVDENLGKRLFNNISHKYRDKVIGFKVDDYYEKYKLYGDKYIPYFSDDVQEMWDNEKNGYDQGVSSYYASKKSGDYSGD